MSIVKITLPLGEVPVNGKQVTFATPCSCLDTEALEIEGEQYTVVDALGNCVTGIGGRWVAGATVSVILDVENKRACILNESSGVSTAVAELFGLGEDATVDEVFGQFGKHWWKRRAKNVETVLGSVEQVGAVKLNGSISYSDSVIVNNETGTVSLSEPILSMTLGSADAASALAGKYIAPSLSDLSGKIFFVESSAGFASGNYIYLNIQQVTASVVEGETEYVSSPNRNEYPDSGYVEGYEYAHLGVPFDNARNGGAKIETGSYVGAGTYGANNPCTLTFGFEPKLLLVSSDVFSLYPNSGYWKNGTLWMYGTTAAYTTASSTSVNFSLNGNTLSWYGNNSAAAQLNTSGTTYHYIAIG